LATLKTASGTIPFELLSVRVGNHEIAGASLGETVQPPSSSRDERGFQPRFSDSDNRAATQWPRPQQRQNRKSPARAGTRRPRAFSGLRTRWLLISPTSSTYRARGNR